MEILKVSSKTKASDLAGALAGSLERNKSVEVQAIGAGSVNQAVKAIAIARGFVAPQGTNLITMPAFAQVQLDGEERTAIKFIVEPR